MCPRFGAYFSEVRISCPRFKAYFCPVCIDVSEIQGKISPPWGWLPLNLRHRKNS